MFKFRFQKSHEKTSVTVASVPHCFFLIHCKNGSCENTTATERIGCLL
uniref:Uncharacterized protein n=1 Tax=Anguilla anguilla TaxID=7936 RepID=A0A0E9PES8_ANGAN